MGERTDMRKSVQWIIIVLMIGSLTLTASDAYAEQVISKGDGNVFTLESGAKVSLAGLEIPVESHSLISVLLAKKEVKIRPDQMLSDVSMNPSVQPVYLYVNTSELAFPFADALNTKNKKVVVNELLLAMGAAFVQTERDFELKEHFLEIQEQAKTEGKGIWSYEEPVL